VSVDSALSAAPVAPVAPAPLKQRILWETVWAAWRGTGSHPDRMAHAAHLNGLLHDTPTDSTPPVRALPELFAADATPRAVAELSKDLCRPVVIRGLARDTEAVRTWRAAYFAQRLPDQHCTVLRTNDESAFTLGTIPMERMSVPEFMGRVLAEPLYLNNSTELFSLDPDLVDHLALPELETRLLGRAPTSQFFTTQLFIGSQAVHSRLHHAVGGNVFVQVHGRKRWTFVDPAHTAHLLPVPGPKLDFNLSGFGGFRRRRELGLSPGPLAHIPRFETVLQPGDVLYNAPWWWHEVENLDAGTIGCAVRRIPPLGTVSPSLRNLPHFTLANGYPLRRHIAALIDVVGRIRGSRFSLLHRANRLLHKRLHASFGSQHNPPTHRRATPSRGEHR